MREITIGTRAKTADADFVVVSPPPAAGVVGAGVVPLGFTGGAGWPPPFTQ